MNKLRTCISVFLITLMALVCCRYVIFNSYVRVQKHEYRKKALENHIGEVRTIDCRSQDLYNNKPGFEWKKNNKEVVINGVYHEVLNIVRKGSAVKIYVIPDTEESKLFNSYFTSDKNKDNNSSICALILNVLMMFEKESIHFTRTADRIHYNVTPEGSLPSGHTNSMIKPPACFTV